MKILVKYFVFLISFSGFSQRIQNVNVSLVNTQSQSSSSQVLVRFTLTAGLSCPGYELMHSLDSLNYIQFYSYSSVCGNQSTDESFSNIHSSPGINQVNYYKVNIPGFETSAAYRIFVGPQAPKSTLLVYPNPIFNDSYIHLRFYNYIGSKVEGYVYNQFGTAVKPLSLTIDQDLSEVNVNDLNDGLYVVWVTDGNILFRAKFIVKRI